MTAAWRFGAVRKLPSGRWQARCRTPEGRLIAAPETFRTKTDASLYLDALEVDQTRGVGSIRRRLSVRACGPGLRAGLISTAQP